MPDNNNPILLFDFDGTLADTFHTMVQIGNRLADEFHFDKVTPQDIHILKDKGSKEIIDHLRIPLLKVPLIAARARVELLKTIEYIKPPDGLKESLLKLKKSGCRMGILTSNSAENVQKFLKRHGLNVFDLIRTTPKIFGKSRGIRMLQKSERLSPEEIIYIGDETRDIEAARKAGVRIAAVSWGYNSAKVLKNHKPDWIFSAPSQLLQLVSVPRQSA